MSQPRLKIEVAEAAEADHPALRRMMQLYCYDFTAFSQMPLNDDGTYGSPEFIEEQFGPGHQTFVLRVNGNRAGFAIVSPRSYLTDDEGVTDVAQFFVMRAQRRDGVGAFMAHDLFSRFPGRWEVRVIEENAVAIAFWRKAIRIFTNNRFDETLLDTQRHTGTVYSFESGGSPARQTG